MEKNSARISIGTVLCMFIILVLIFALATERSKNANVTANEDGMQITNSNINTPTSNLYKIYQENYKDWYKKTMVGDNRIYKPTGGEVPGVYAVYLDSNNDAYFEIEENSQLYKKYGKKYKVETNVANIYLCPLGTGGYAEVVFLKLDGTASRVSGYDLEQNYVIECNIIQGIKNAVNVITYTYVAYDEYGELGASGPERVFIDINGNWIYEHSNIDSKENVDVVKSKNYGEPLPIEGVALLKGGYLYYSYNNSEEPEKIGGVSNIKSLDIFNIGTGINRVPFVVTEDGVVYRLNSAKQLVVYEELSNYKVDKIISHEGEMYDVFTLLLLDGTTKVVEVKDNISKTEELVKY